MGIEIKSDSFQDVFADLQNYADLDGNVNTALRKSGNVIKDHVVGMLNSSESLRKEYDGSEHTHLKDDVHVVVKKAKSTGSPYVSVKGGKYTGYKWTFLNDGYHDRGLNWHPGNNFCDRALSESEGGIMEAIDELAKKVADG